MAESPATPFAITTGDGCGVWYLIARATCSVGGVGSTNGAIGAPGFSTARPTWIRCSAFVDGIGPFPFSRRTSQCDGTQGAGSRPASSCT